MTPFNVGINHGDEKVTLTIIPKENYYIIIYLGDILGAIRKTGSDWTLLQQAEIDTGALAYFDDKLRPEGAHLSIGIHEINLIAGEIENYLVKQ